MTDFDRSSIDLANSLKMFPVRDMARGVPTALTSVAFGALNLGLDAAYFVGTRTPKLVQGARERIKTGANAAAGGFLALTGADYPVPIDQFDGTVVPFELLPDVEPFHTTTPTTPSVVHLQQREIGR